MASRVFSRLASLAECLCAQIDLDEAPPVCFCGVVPGDAAAHYTGACNGGNGMAWVRLVTMYPAVTPGVADATEGNCGSGSGLQVEVGIMRDFIIGDARGNPPSSDDQVLAAAELQMDDAMTMQRAIACCGDENSTSKDWVLGSYTPVGPLGALVGGTWTVSLVL